MNRLLTISPSPHINQIDSVKKIMYTVIFALLPALVWSFIVFGIPAIILTLTSVLTCVVFEWAIQKYILKSKPTITDGSAVITGILLAMNMPAGLPVWMIVIGALVAIGVGKMSFGGLGQNPFNPALVGRVFLLISYPVQMTTWPNVTGHGIDAVSEATPLALFREGVSSGQTVSQIMENIPSYRDLLLGNFSGSLGEVSAALLILGLIYMLIKKVVSWHIPITTLGTMFVFAAILWKVNPELYADPLFHLLTGGAMLGAIFMATDYASSPMSKSGQIVYAIGIGVITICIRTWGAYPEGISFAILIMNALTPLINNYFKTKRFGEK